MPLKGINASAAAQLFETKSQLNNPATQSANQEDELKSLCEQVEANLVSQGFANPDRAMIKSMAAQALASGLGGLVTKATDPVILPQPYVSPTDFAAQYPQPLDPTEILTLCEEISAWRVLPEVVTDYQADQWREMTSLDFTGDGLTYQGFFDPGACPEEYTHDGENKTITRRYLGAKKSLTNEEIRHSMAVSRIQGLGISAITDQLNGKTQVIGVREKEIKLQEITTLRN